MERRILFNNADDFEREVFRSEFDSLFDTNNAVDKRRREQFDTNDIVNKRRREQIENRIW